MVLERPDSIRAEEVLVKRVGTCSICSETYEGLGHNAEPVNSGRCCGDCNALVVVPARIERRRAARSAAQEPRPWPSADD